MLKFAVRIGDMLLQLAPIIVMEDEAPEDEPEEEFEPLAADSDSDSDSD